MRRKLWAQTGFAAAILAVCAWSLAPFLWQVITSLKPAAEVAVSPPLYWPTKPTLESYGLIFTLRPFAVYIKNSLLVSAGATVLATLLGALAAYAFSRPRLAGTRWAMGVVMAVSLFPPTLLIVALKQMVGWAGLLNNPLALILAYAGLNLPFAIWTLTTFFRQIPKDIEDAARMDGFPPWKILAQIIMPVAAPAVATTAILVFIFCWNEFLLALSFMSRDASRTVPVGIALLSGASIYEVPWGQISAAVVVTTLPVVALVLGFQKRIMEGMTAGAVKG